jgi:hypothetical protein
VDPRVINDLVGKVPDRIVLNPGDSFEYVLNPLSHICGLFPAMQAWYQEGFLMKMNGQSRTFVKQVKFDLLALSDADLLQIIQQWVEGSKLSNQPLEKAEKIWLALGYTHKLSDPEGLSQLKVDLPGSEIEEPVSWIAPDPQLLRNLIAAMDEQQFAQYVISIAFQSLHPLYPEWYDGLTFNAHLANYLRQINTKRRTVPSRLNK